MDDGGQFIILTWIIFVIIRWISDTVSLSNLFLNLTTSICIMFRADCETGGLIWWLVYPIIVAGLVPAHISLDFRDQYASSPEISEPVPHWSRNFEISRYWSRSRNSGISTYWMRKFSRSEIFYGSLTPRAACSSSDACHWSIFVKFLWRGFFCGCVNF